jgi:hypothetical protein
VARYFNNFPKIGYSLETINQYDYVTNIVSRFGIDNKLKENTAIYYEYSVEDGETPEILASKYYDSPEKHWIILAMNNIVDPQFDWPLTYSQFNQYVDTKYSANNYADTANTGVPGLSYAQKLYTQNDPYTQAAYYKVVSQTIGDTITVNKFKVDANTYANNTLMNLTGRRGNIYEFDDGAIITIKITKETQTYYDYEMEINENKRNIKMLKPEYVNILENELLNVFEQ